jgi:hypothetical protein
MPAIWGWDLERILAKTVTNIGLFGAKLSGFALVE